MDKNQSLSLIQIYKLFSNIVIPSKEIRIDELKKYTLNMLNELQVEQDKFISDGIISKNGGLDFPPEVLLKIFENIGSNGLELKYGKWSLELRKLNLYLFDIYNRYSKFNVLIETQSDLNFSRNISLPLSIGIKNIIPNSLDGIHSITINRNGECISDIRDITVLSKMLENNDTVITLNIIYSFINDDCIIILSKSLENNKTLITLNLEGNSIRNDGATALARVIETNDILTTINLCENRIEDGGAIALARALKNNRALTALNLSDNNFESLCIPDFVESLDFNTTLKTLNLKYNSISQASIATLSKHKERTLILRSEFMDL